MLREWVLAHNRSKVASYRNLKLFIGVLGMALPAMLVVVGLFYPGHVVQHSVSHYYHTDLRDLFVGTLATASVLFMTDAGYGIIDDILTWAVGVSGIGVILFPCPTFPEMPQGLVGVFRLTQEVSGPIHFCCSGAFFFLLAINSIFLFTLSKEKTLGTAKRTRNLVYIACGAIILVCLAALLVLSIVASDFFNGSSIALVFETVMLLAFGFAWLVKADIGLFRDTVSTGKRFSRNPRRN